MMGFIYRDLKPENILMHASGHIMLTDFDLSKQAATSVGPQVVKKMFGNSPEIFSTPELVSNSFVGTAEYIAPEVIKGFGQSSSVDWWTFGILIYEMLYGATPYRGRTQDDTFSHILEGGLKFPEQHMYPVCGFSRIRIHTRSPLSTVASCITHIHHTLHHTRPHPH